jgi:hypothetical protein
MSDLTNPESLQDVRIDYVFVAAPPARCVIGGASGPFNAEPALGPIAYPSDHTAVIAALACTEPVSRMPTTFPPPPPTTPATAPVPSDAQTAQAITTAFETLFGAAEPDVEARLSYLEDAERLRDTFLTIQEQAGDLAATTTVRVDSIAQRSPTTADVVFSVLVGGNVALDHIQGGAVNTDGRWLVSAATFCTLATTLAPDASGCSQ